MAPKLTILALAATAATGTATGAALEMAGVLDLAGERAVVVSLDPVAYLDCPDGIALGDFHRADRVLATARDRTGRWLQVRSPANPDRRVWVEAGWVVADRPVDDLPVAACDTLGATTTTTVLGGPSTSTATAATTAPGASTTSVALPPPAFTAAPPTSPGTTGAPTTTEGSAATTTTPADTAGPTIGALEVLPDLIWEDGVYCGGQDHVATIAVTITDPSGLGLVSLGWQVGAVDDSAEMTLTGGDLYAVAIGPFGDTTVSADAPVQLTVSATDGVGNGSVVSAAPITLRNCTVG